MSRKLVVPGLIVLTVGGFGFLDGASADGRQGVKPEGLRESRLRLEQITVAKTLGTYRYYGRREYRCRRFSTVCYHYRPVYYGHYWSTEYRLNDYWFARARPPARLGRYHVGSPSVVPGAVIEQGKVGEPVPGAHKGVILEQSGGFVRIMAPRNATHWVRADTLAVDK